MASKGITERNTRRLDFYSRYEQAFRDVERKKAAEAKAAKRKEDAEIDRVIREILRIPSPESKGNKPDPAS